MEESTLPDDSIYRIGDAELAVRLMGVGDAADVFACRTDPAVAELQGWFPRDVAEVEAYARAQAGKRPGEPGIVQLVILVNGEFVGDFGIMGSADHRQAEIGISLRPAAQGKGYATRACRLLLDDLFANGLHRMVARIDPRNLPSQRLFERLGFRREGHERECFWDTRQQVWADEYVYAILASEW